MKFSYIWPSTHSTSLTHWFQRRSCLKVWTDDGRTTEASHTKSSPGAFGSGELKTSVSNLAIKIRSFSFIGSNLYKTPQNNKLLYYS